MSAITRRQWLTLAGVGAASPLVPLTLPQAAQRIPVTIRYNRVRHVKHLIPDLVQSPEFFHQPHGDDLAAQLYRGFFNGEEPRPAKIRQITKNLNQRGPEHVAWSMVTSKRFHDIRRPRDWDQRFHVEKPTRASQDAAYLNRRLEALYEGLYGRRPTSFELTDSLRDLLVPVRSEQIGVMVSRGPQGLRLSTAFAQEAGDGGSYSFSDGTHTISFDANNVLTTAIITEIAIAGKLSIVAGILVGLGVSLIATMPLTGITVTVIGTTILLTSLIPFSLAIYTYNQYYTTLSSSPTGGGQPGDPYSPPPPSDPPPPGQPGLPGGNPSLGSDPGLPPGASMDVSVSIGSGPAPGDIGAPGSDPGDPGDGGGDGGSAGDSSAGDGGDGDGGGGGDGGW